MHRFLLHNDAVQEISQASASAGQTGLMNGWGVFTTIRVCDGVLFAWERHWERMKSDARRLRVPFPDRPEWMRERLDRLVEANCAHNATLRIVVARNHGGLFQDPAIVRDFDLFAFTAGLTKWPEAARLGVKRDARHAACEFAGVKTMSWAFNLAWYEEAHELGLDEFVLLNELGEVSECTSANVFAVQGGEVWTPPLSSGCLPGITRELLLNEARVPGIRVEERNLTLADVQRADCVFLTSSTRDVMLVYSIEGLTIRRNDAVARSLGQALESYRRQYVACGVRVC